MLTFLEQIASGLWTYIGRVVALISPFGRGRDFFRMGPGLRAFLHVVIVAGVLFGLYWANYYFKLDTLLRATLLCAAASLFLAADPLPPSLHHDLAGLVALEAARPRRYVLGFSRYRRGLGAGRQGAARQSDGTDQRAALPRARQAGRR